MSSFGDIFGSIGGAIASSRMGKRYGDLQGLAKQEAEIRKREAEKARADAAKVQYTVGPAARKAYAMSQQDRAGDIVQRQIEKQAAQGLGALTTGGAKALMGGVSKLQSDSADRIQEAAAASQERKRLGQLQYSGIEQDIDLKNKEAQKGLSMFDYGRALQLEQGASQRERGMLLSREQARGQATQQGLTAVGQAGDVVMDMYTMGMAKGGKIKETPGEFSHKSNPIDLVRNGTKIGEATGGELIFNPEQSGKLETLATEGSTELHKYLRGLFKKFNKKS
tara:strand:+ start:7238 stop:8077 length:840 start_codon:yes stop_codon:yes gene_type:complete